MSEKDDRFWNVILDRLRHSPRLLLSEATVDALERLYPPVEGPPGRTEELVRMLLEQAKEQKDAPNIIRGQAYAALCNRCRDDVFEPVFDLASQTWIHGADTITSGVTIPAEECQANALRLLWQCAKSES